MYIMKKNAKKGFTLAELLIVVAIIAVLVAIMFPVFGAQLNKAKADAELANVRARYSELVADALLGDGKTLTDTVDTVSFELDKLGAILSYKGSKITYTPGDAATEKDGSIKVEYSGYSGEFKTDSAVTITKGTGSEEQSDKTITFEKK